MSGGHFDYQQYRVGDIAKAIEQDIAKALQPKPDKVHEDYWTIIEYDSLYGSRPYRDYMIFTSYKEAESFLLDSGTVQRTEKKYSVKQKLPDGQIYQSASAFMNDTGEDEQIPILYSITHCVYDRYPYDADVLEFTDQTIETMKEAYRQIRIAEIYAQRVDWMMSGDDSEETFQERLREELESFEEEFKNKDWSIIDEEE